MADSGPYAGREEHAADLVGDVDEFRAGPGGYRKILHCTVPYTLQCSPCSRNARKGRFSRIRLGDHFHAPAVQITESGMVRFSPVLEKPPGYGMDSGVVDRCCSSDSEFSGPRKPCRTRGIFGFSRTRLLLVLFLAFKKSTEAVREEQDSIPHESAFATVICIRRPVMKHLLIENREAPFISR